MNTETIRGSVCDGKVKISLILNVVSTMDLSALHFYSRFNDPFIVHGENPGSKMSVVKKWTRFFDPNMQPATPEAASMYHNEISQMMHQASMSPMVTLTFEEKKKLWELMNQYSQRFDATLYNDIYQTMSAITTVEDLRPNGHAGWNGSVGNGSNYSQQGGNPFDVWSDGNGSYQGGSVPRGSLVDVYSQPGYDNVETERMTDICIRFDRCNVATRKEILRFLRETYGL